VAWVISEKFGIEMINHSPKEIWGGEWKESTDGLRPAAIDVPEAFCFFTILDLKYRIIALMGHPKWFT